MVSSCYWSLYFIGFHSIDTTEKATRITRSFARFRVVKRVCSLPDLNLACDLSLPFFRFVFSIKEAAIFAERKFIYYLDTVLSLALRFKLSSAIIVGRKICCNFIINRAAPSGRSGCIRRLKPLLIKPVIIHGYINENKRGWTILFSYSASCVCKFRQIKLS